MTHTNPCPKCGQTEIHTVCPEPDPPFASQAAEAAYQQAVKDGVKITRYQVRRMLQAFDIERGEHDLNNEYAQQVLQLHNNRR
jgi:hypothetical protein